MTERQKRFCDEYLICCNATQAAAGAGYSKKSAYSTGQRLLKNAEIKSYIDDELKLMHSEKIADAEEVMEYLTSVMRGQQKDQVLQLIGEGAQEITDIQVSSRDRLKAAELIGKRYGMFKENVNLEGSVPVVIAGSDDLED